MNWRITIGLLRLFLSTCVFASPLVSCTKSSNPQRVRFEMSSGSPSGASTPVTVISWNSSGRANYLMIADAKLENGFKKVDLTRVDLENIINSRCGWGASELSDVADFAKDGGFEIRDINGHFVCFSNRLGNKLMFPSSR